MVENKQRWGNIVQDTYKKWERFWRKTLDQIRLVIPEENIYPLMIQPPATESEIEELEGKLGYLLPATFRHTLLHFSKGVDLFWNMYEEVEEIIPEEFEGISTGVIRWGIDDHNLEDLTEYATMLDEKGKHDKNYRSSLHGKLKFMSIDNGDIIAFDLLADGEPPVVYWDHETEEVSYLAASFHIFINQITQLYCIGNESWQYAPFLTSKGLDTECENAKRWKNWFRAFVSRSE